MIERCPCGQIPDHLIIAEGQCSKWAYVSGVCCGEWNVEFRTGYRALDDPKLMEEAIDEWNEAKRSKR